MAAVQDVKILICEVMEEWELERAKYLSQIRTLQAENDALGKRKRKKNGFGCLGKKKRFGSPEKKAGLSSADEEACQEKLSAKLYRIGDIYNDLKVRHCLVLEQLAEQKRCRNQLNTRIRQIETSAHYNQLERDGISRLHLEGQITSSPHVRTRVRQTPDLTKIEDIPELSKVSLASDDGEYQTGNRSISRTTGSEKRNGNKKEYSERCVHSTIHDETLPVSRIPSKAGTFLNETSAASRMPCRTSTNLSEASTVSRVPSRTGILDRTSTVTKIPSRSVPKVGKKASPPAYKYESIANYKELPKDVKLVMEAERERYRLEMRALLVEIGEKDEHIETLRTQIKVKDAQISQLASIVYVGQKLIARK